jgi:serine protease inhibitor
MTKGRIKHFKILTAGVEIVALSGFVEIPEEVYINRPFIFSIRDTRTGAILFIGRVNDPSKQ